MTVARFLEQLHANIEAKLDVDDDDTPMTVCGCAADLLPACASLLEVLSENRE